MVDFDFEKYKNDGWGLSRKEFQLLFKVINDHFFRQKKMTVVEFGSGRSTEFLIDMIEKYNLDIEIHSFDDSDEYAYKGTHPKLTLNILPLVECDDDVFINMFKAKKFDRSKMRSKTTPVHTRQRNTFYMVSPSMIPNNIDLLIVDGPHGNGRSLAYLHCFEKFSEYVNATVLIDDASHYPFYDHLKMIADVEMLDKQHERLDKWESGGDFILCSVRK